MARHTVLVGLMGAGKTSVGQAVATRLGWPFTDSDDEIERRTGRTATAVKEADGEDALHDLEAAHLLAALGRSTPSVIAAAASVIDRPACGAALASAFTVWLRADPARLAERFDDQDHRPAYGDDVAAFLERQARDRGPGYAAVASLTLDVADRTVEDLAVAIVAAATGPSADRADGGPVSHPSSTVRTVPTDAIVWVMTDPHGVRTGLLAALQDAGLTDPHGRWIAPPRTVLVGCGDYVDRGRDSDGVVGLLRRLEGDGHAVLARGNHEQMLLEWMASGGNDPHGWLDVGGQATLASFGLEPAAARSAPAAAARELADRRPWLGDWLDGLPHAVRWRDVLFVHAGPSATESPDQLGATDQDHLWVRSAFFAAPWDARDPRFGQLEAHGVGRIVFGHTPMPGATSFHGGRSLALDTNACGQPSKRHIVPHLTLARVAGSGPPADALLSVRTANAPDRMA